VAEPGGFEAQAAFDRLAAMEGTWTGMAAGKGAAEAEGSFAVTHTFQLSANGTVVMETMNPGTPHEMINMYHLDGGDLVLTHYCAGGNQPHMRSVAEKSTLEHLVFDFDGGTNLDPAKDPHIHAARIDFLEDGAVDSIWISRNEGAEAGEMAFHLSRAE
jgi:hypothetical protein